MTGSFERLARWRRAAARRLITAMDSDAAIVEATSAEGEIPCARRRIAAPGDLNGDQNVLERL